MSKFDALTAFGNAMLDKGITPPGNFIGDGKLRRFHVEGDRKGTLNGAYILHLDNRPSGWFMHFKTGFSTTWAQSGKKEPMTDAMKKLINDARKERQQEQAKAHQDAAKKALYLWRNSVKIAEASQHPYLINKRINPHGARLYNEALIIPLVDDTGAIVNLQFIHANGEKRFLSGGKKKGCYYLLGGDGSKLLVAEGFATAASLNEATQYAVYVAFDCGNLKDVATLAAKQSGKASLNTEIIICGDNDVSGVGQRAAREAALVCCGKYKIPLQAGTDWNDVLTMEVCRG